MLLILMLLLLFDITWTNASNEPVSWNNQLQSCPRTSQSNNILHAAYVPAERRSKYIIR